MRLFSKRSAKLTPAVGGPKYTTPVIIGDRGEISANFLYDPEAGELVHTVHMQQNGIRAVRRSLAARNVSTKLAIAALKVRLFALRFWHGFQNEKIE